MKGRISASGKVVLIIAIQLMTAGCITGGVGSLFGFLEGNGFLGGDGDPATILSSLSPSTGGQNHSNNSDLSWDKENYAGDDGDQSNESDEANGTNPTNNLLTVATLHNPEPASVILFAVGLSGVTCLRRRRNMRKSQGVR